MSSLVGVSVLDTYSPTAYAQSGKGFGLGDFHRDDTGRGFVYVQASAAVAASDVVQITSAYAIATVTTANSLRGTKIGVAPVAFAADDYGWVQVDGPATANVLANCAANVRINTTATPGKLDDDGTAGAKQIQGIVLTTANGAGANARAAILNYPYVDVTI